MAKTQTSQADVPEGKAGSIDPMKLPTIVEALGKAVAPDYGDAEKEYDVRQHAVFDPVERPDKTKKDGKKVKVNRIALPLQKLIVNRRVAFMNVGAIKLEANPEDDDQKRLYEMVKKIRDDNKMDFIENEVATRMLSELQVAKLWYSTPSPEGYWGELTKNGKFRLRCEVLSPKKGDSLYPVFDRYGDLIYFGRIYETPIDIGELVTAGNNNHITKVKRFDIYSKTHIYRFREPKGGESLAESDWIIEEAKAHSYGKIPVIYYGKTTPPWADVQHAINRLETVLSNFGDTNDYHGSPTLAFLGEVMSGLPEKGESGKAVQIKPANGSTQADVKYVTWEHAPEAIKLEIETLAQYIFTCTQTPQMSMEDMKELGNVSGVAYDRIFLDAHLAARAEIMGPYGMGTQRDINFVKAACGAIDTSLASAVKQLEIKFDIPIFRINDDKEQISNIASAIGAGILSIESALEFFPWIQDAQEELKRLTKEKASLNIEREVEDA
jgi:chorismate mutase